MKNNKFVIGQQLVAQLVKRVWIVNINLLFLLTQRSLKTIILVNTPAKPMKFDLSSFTLKLCGFSFFSASLIPLLTKNLSSVLNNNQREFI